MKEFVEKLIGRLEELYHRNDKTKKEAYQDEDWEKFDLFTHRNEGVYSAISIVNQLAEEYKGGWIPVEQRLPKKDETVIVTYEDRFFGSNYMGVCAGRLLTLTDKGWEIEDYGNADNFKVIAWQPLPEPFKESE